MAITISGVNYSQITSMNTDVTGGTWSGSTPTEDLDYYKEGSGSMSFTMKSNGTNDTTFTPSASVNLSGTKHLRFWFLDVHGGDFTSVQIGISDGSNTGYWVVATAAEYPGGWYQAIIDVSSTVDSGTKPTSMGAITSFIFRVTLTGGKNFTNFWLDNLIYCDGLQMYGDDSGSDFDYDDVWADSGNLAEATGILDYYNGVYFVVGSLIHGDTATANLNFIAKSFTLVFKDKSDYVNSALYAITVQGNSTGATQKFELGEASGGAGINGCTIICVDPTLAFEFTATDTDVDDFGLYGSTFNTYGTFDVQPDGTNLEILNCTFVNGVGQFQPNTMDVTNCNFISGPSSGVNGTVLIESSSHSITYCNFISNTNAIEVSVAASISFNNLKFTGNTYDVYNSSGSAITVSQTDSDASNYNPAGSVVSFETTVNITITVEDIDQTAIEGAQVYMQKSSPTTYNSHATNNSQGDTTFEASAAVDSDTAASGWLIIRAVDEREWHWYRYASRTSTVFTLPTTSSGSQTGSTSQTILIDSGASFGGTEDVKEGDLIRNTSDGSWAQISNVDSTTQLITSKLVGGSLNTWTNGDNYSIHTLEMTYDSSDTFKVPLVNDNTDGDGEVSFSYVHPGGTVVANIQVRYSPDTGTKYLPASASASFSGTYSTTITMAVDTTAD